MNALMTIQTNTANAKPSADNGKAVVPGNASDFSQALEKHVKDNSRAENSQESQTVKGKASTDNSEKPVEQKTKAAESASEDGKNRPEATGSDKATETETAETETAETETAETETADTETAETEKSDASDKIAPLIKEMPEAEFSVVGTEESQANSDSDPKEVDSITNTDNKAEQKTAVTVAVAAPALEKSATDKVNMTLSENAKAQPKSDTSNEDADVKVNLKQFTPVVSNASEVESRDSKLRFADILKKEGAAANAIRADILQAISQKTASGNTDGQTLKTSLQNLLMGSAENKPASNGQVAELIRQIQPGQAHGKDNLSPAAALMPVTNSPASSTASALPQIAMDVQPQLNNPAWSRVVSSRVVWMAREGVQQAELRLNPASLGSVDVRLSITNDQASVTFLAQNAATREALEQALPRLRESLAENGLSLSHSEVGEQENPDQQAAEQETSMQNSHSAQVSVQLDDTEDEQVTGLQHEVNESATGVSLYA